MRVFKIYGILGNVTVPGSIVDAEAILPVYVYI